MTALMRRLPEGVGALLEQVAPQLPGIADQAWAIEVDMEQGRKEEGVRKLAKLSLKVANPQAAGELENAEQLVAALQKGDMKDARDKLLQALEMQMDAAMAGVHPCEDEQLGMVKRVWNAYKAGKEIPGLVEDVRNKNVVGAITRAQKVWGLI